LISAGLAFVKVEYQQRCIVKLHQLSAKLAAILTEAAQIGEKQALR
jgi:hypothetical protein